MIIIESIRNIIWSLLNPIPMPLTKPSMIDRKICVLVECFFEVRRHRRKIVERMNTARAKSLRIGKMIIGGSEFMYSSATKKARMPMM